MSLLRALSIMNNGRNSFSRLKLIFLLEDRSYNMKLTRVLLKIVIVITKAAPAFFLFLLIENNNIERYCMN